MIPFLMVVIPLFTAVVLLVIPSNQTAFYRTFSLLSTLFTLILGVILWWLYPPGMDGYLEGYWGTIQFFPFPHQLGASFHLGVDGISLIFGVLSALLSVLVVMFSWGRVEQFERSYFITILLITGTLLGIFFSRDLLLFYLFWEAVILPMYFLVGVWGGDRSIYASIKFVLYTLAGSLMMLVSIVVLFSIQYASSGQPSMAITSFYELSISPDTAFWLFVGFCLAFAIKTPLFPVHTWLPDAHVEAPSSGSVILAGILLKVGIYGFIRLLIPIFPSQSIQWALTLSTLGVIGIIYGGLVAWVQEDVKKLVAYSSISHLGFVVLGLFSLNVTSVTGGLLQGAIHGVNTGALFLMLGMLYTRIHTRDIDSIGGLANQLPVFSTFLCIFAFASIGLPGTNGFVGEFLILSSSFDKFPILASLGAGGVIVSALYMLYMLRECVFGPITEKVEPVSDLGTVEILTLVPLLILVFWIGLYPAPVINRLEPTVHSLLLNQVPSHQMAERASAITMENEQSP